MTIRNQNIIYFICLEIVERFGAILNDVNVWADNRDAVYIESDYFQFKSDDDFLFLYGVNMTNRKSGLFQCYGDEHFNGIAVANTTTEFKGSAAHACST